MKWFHSKWMTRWIPIGLEKEYINLSFILKEEYQIFTFCIRSMVSYLKNMYTISNLPKIYSNSCPLSQWCHPTISSSVVPFFSGLQTFPSITVFSNESALRIRWPKYWSFSFNISPVNIHKWFPLGWTGWISLQSKWLSRVFSNTIVQKNQFFGTQLSL